MEGGSCGHRATRGPSPPPACWSRANQRRRLESMARLVQDKKCTEIGCKREVGTLHDSSSHVPGLGRMVDIFYEQLEVRSGFWRSMSAHWLRLM